MEKNMYIPGDWVYIHGSVRVIAQCDGYYASFYDEEEFLQEVNTNIIEGIALTPIILEENGWKKIDIMPYPTYAKGKTLEYSLIFIKDVWCFKYDGRMLPIEIKYLHELQHLLFGLGINNEMEV